MNSKQPIGPRTIGELKNYLKLLEDLWTEEDIEYLGPLDEQRLYIDTPAGMAYGYMQYSGDFGLITYNAQE
jgi:hypothetical protein